MPRYKCQPFDREMFERFLANFVPPDTFDVHSHLYRQRELGDAYPPNLRAGPEDASYEEWYESARYWMGDKLTPRDGLFFPFPATHMDVAAGNDYLDEQIRSRPGSRGLMMIKPTDDPAKVERWVVDHKFSGFKCYHLFAARKDTPEAEIGEFLTDWAWEIADRHNLAIMLHIVRARALADELNQRYIREYCLRYPGARLILAHAARGFCAGHTVEGIGQIRGLDNVYFDTSCICESSAFRAILQTFGTRRLMYGSDYPVSEVRGRAIAMSDGFFWLSDTNPKWDGWTMGTHTLVGVESLLAIREACQEMHLTDSDVEAIFSTNARQLLGVTPAPSGERTQALYEEAKRIIPGGVQLLSKRPEMFAPGQWPGYQAEAHGCEVIDVEGRKFIDMSICGIGACALGYADLDVTAAVIRRVQLGSMSTLNDPAEVELAKLLLQMHPWAQMARFSRAGGEAMAIAVRIARAKTRRDTIAFCGYHGWHDWYIAANLSKDGAGDSLKGHLLPGLDPAGVPSQLAGTVLPFAYNQIDQLRKIVKEHGKTLAAVVMEPTRSEAPAPGFLEGVREICESTGCAMIFDEITTGFRLHRGGAHLRYGVAPDIAVFAKALGNGHPIAAIVGRANYMQAAQQSFISSTYWTEGVGPTAGVATLRKMMRINLPAHLDRIGRLYRDGVQQLATRHKVPVKIGGHPALTTVTFENPQAAAIQTLLTVRMLSRGFLTGGAFYPTLAHDDRHVKAYLTAADPVFAEIAESDARNDIRARIGGPVKHTGFARLA